MHDLLVIFVQRISAIDQTVFYRIESRYDSLLRCESIWLNSYFKFMCRLDGSLCLAVDWSFDRTILGLVDSTE